MYTLPDQSILLNASKNLESRDPIVIFIPVNRYLGFRSLHDPIGVFQKIARDWNLNIRFVDPQKVTVKVFPGKRIALYEGEEEVKGSVYFSYAHDSLDRITMRYVMFGLEKSGAKLITNGTSLTFADDKGFAAITLSQEGISIPDSYLATAKSSAERVLELVDGVREGVLFSKSTGHASGGVGVTPVMGTRFFLQPFLWNIRNDLKPKLMQKDAYTCDIDTPRKVIRVYVVGGKVVGSYYTSALGYVNTIDLRKEKIELGQYAPTPEEEEMCIKAAKILSCDGYCRIDASKQELFTILEVNPVADIDAIKYGLNIHEHLLWYAMQLALA